MLHRAQRRDRPTFLLVTLILLAVPASAADFPAVTPEEQALSGFPGEPRAPAIEIFHKGELQLMDPSRQRMSSLLRIERRIKILTEEGRDEYSEFAVRHSRFARLTDLAGRTVLPDGTTVPLDDGAVFEETISEKSRWYLTKAAFPAVEVGAILDLQYSLRFETILYLEPWDFQGEIPSLHSEIQYFVPETLGMAVWDRVTFPGGEIESENDRSGAGRRLRFWMTNVPSVPQEPMGFPIDDLRTRFMLYPGRIVIGGEMMPLFEDWRSTAGFFGDDYKLAGKKAGKAKKRARALATSAATPRDKAEVLYRFVRDEIDNRFTGLVWVDSDFAVDDTLRDGSGDSPEKALLLASMLEAVKIPAELVWTGYRTDGRIDPRLSTPYSFDNVVVRVGLDGDTVWLDPTDRTLPFGVLDPDNLGMLGLVIGDRPKDTELIELPQATPEQGGENATLVLKVDELGALEGTVELRYTGHLASALAPLDQEREDVRQEWEKRVGEDFGVEVSDLVVTSDVDRGVLLVSMRVRLEAEADTSELSIPVSQPHGPLINELLQPPDERVTPVLLDPPSRQSLSLTLEWAPNWTVDLEPTSDRYSGDAGRFIGTVNLDEEARRLVYGRVLETRQRELLDQMQYASLQELYRVAEDHDAQPFVLLRD